MQKTTLYFWLVFLFISLWSCKKDNIPVPAAAFTISNGNPKVDEVISFANQSENATTFEWSFGDGTISTLKDPTHSYSNIGTYTVSLKATGEGGSNTTTQIVSVSELPAMANFSIENTSAEIGETITFTNLSQNASTYNWDFGDGNTSIETNPSHAYHNTGTFTVTLNASNNSSNNSISKSIEIEVPKNIFPGEGVGNISLREIWGSIKTMTGYDFTEYGPIVLSTGAIFHPVEEKSKGVLLYFLGSGIIKRDSDPVILITLSSPFVGITEKGIGIGNTLTEVRNAYGTEEKFSANSNTYQYTSLGIDFAMDESNEVKRIVIY